MSSDERQPSVSFRVPQSLLDNLEELRPLLEELPEYAARGKLNRSELLRIALAHGVERLRATLHNRSDDVDQVDLLEDDQEEFDVEE